MGEPGPGSEVRSAREEREAEGEPRVSVLFGVHCLHWSEPGTLGALPGRLIFADLEGGESGQRAWGLGMWKREDSEAWKEPRALT